MTILTRFSCFAILLSSFIVLGCQKTSADIKNLKIGEPVPEFSLASSDGAQVSLSNYKGKVVVLEWFNRGCPFVVNHYKNGHMQELQKKAKDQEIVWLIINSTHPGHKDFLSEEKSQALIEEWKINSAKMLIDRDGKVGQLYGALTTPHLFVIDQKGTLVYSGAIDDTNDWEHDPAQAKNYVSIALEEVAKGQPVTMSFSNPYGCSVKYAD